MDAKKRMVVILGSFQGKRPIIVSREDGEPLGFASMDEAREFTCQPSCGLDACHNLVIVDIETGETDTL